jgi:transposase
MLRRYPKNRKSRPAVAPALRLPRRPYDTDLSDDQWATLDPLLSAKLSNTDRREIFNAILYFLRNGCAWRALPHDFPPPGTVNADFRGGKPTDNPSCLNLKSQESGFGTVSQFLSVMALPKRISGMRFDGQSLQITAQNRLCERAGHDFSLRLLDHDPSLSTDKTHNINYHNLF